MKILSRFQPAATTAAVAGAVLFLAAVSDAPAAGDLQPALKPYAEKFEADCAAARAWGDARLKPERDRYLASLAAAQKEAAAAVKTGDIAAIAAEIEGVNAGSIPKDFPPDLPRSLAQDRRGFYNAAGEVAKTAPQKQRDAAAMYLKTLDALDAEALRKKDRALVDAIAGEKERVLAMMESAGGGEMKANVVENGDFSRGEPGELPPGWKAEAEIPVSHAVIVAEGANRFLRFRRLKALRRANVEPSKEITIPARARHVEFSFRMRAEALAPGDAYNKWPGVHVKVEDATGAELSKSAEVAGRDGGWKRFKGRTELKPNAKTVEVTVGMFGAAGIVDFDDIEVEFR